MENPVQKDITKPKERPKETLPLRDTSKIKNNPKPTHSDKTVFANKKETPENSVVFRVQIATSPKEISIHSAKFAGLPEVWMYQHQGLFKYTSGKASSPEALSRLVAEVKNKGFTDAFIVAFHGDERITITEAKKLISEMQK